MDGSQVYGSDKKTADSLRFFRLGLLLVEPFPTSSGLPILPAAESGGGEAGFCRSSDLVNEPCFRAGDPRVNENQGGRNKRRNFKIMLLNNPKLGKSWQESPGEAKHS